MPPTKIVATQKSGSPGIQTQGNYNFSFTTTGTSPVSGEASFGFSGPFLVEEQELNIEYTRVPYGQQAAYDLTLSSHIPTYTIQGTGLAVRVQASYTRSKIDANYATSSWQTPQKFELYSVSSDPSGNGYAVSGGDSMVSGCMGPQGAVRTIQKWHMRRPWDQGGVGTDSETTQYIDNCYNVGFFTRNQNASGIYVVGAQGCWQDFERYFINRNHAGDPFHYHGPHVEEEVMFNWKPGAYTYAQDSITDVPIFITQIAAIVKNERLYKNVPTQTPENEITYPHYPDRLIADQGCAGYEAFRHDYS